MAENLMQFLRRADYDDIIKAYYGEVKKEMDKATEEEKKVILTMNKIFDSVINSHKNLVRE